MSCVRILEQDNPIYGGSSLRNILKIMLPDGLPDRLIQFTSKRKLLKPYTQPKIDILQDLWATEI